MCNQGECVWLHLDVIKPVLNHCRQCFAEAGYFYCTVPTYPSGQIGFIIGRVGPAVVEEGKEGGSGDGAVLLPLGEPLRGVDDALQRQLRYYNSDMHRASFVLPEFARRALE